MSESSQSVLSIDFGRMKDGGEISLQTELGKPFFASLDQDILTDGTVHLHLLVERQDEHYRLDVALKGTISLICDRSLRDFDFPISVHQKLVFKSGDHFEELDENVWLIPDKIGKTDIAQMVFELIATQIPLKRIHPDEVMENEGDEPVALIYSTAPIVDADEERSNETIKEEEIDPRWKALLKLRKN